MKKSVDLAKAQRQTIQPAQEVMEHLYQVLLATPAFKLRDGSTAAVERYLPPQLDEQGDAKCGIDVRLENGAHLEFTIKNTGWGKSFTDALSRDKTKPPHR